MEATKKRTRDQMEDTDGPSETDTESAKRRRISTPETDDAKVNDTANSSVFASAAGSGFSKFQTGGFQSFAASNDASATSSEKEKESTGNSFGSKSFSSTFSWGNNSSETNGTGFSGFGSSTNTSNFDWASKDYTFGKNKWGEGEGKETDKESFAPTSPTKPREGEIAGVQADPGDSNDVTQFQALVKVFRLEVVEPDGKSSGAGLEAANTTDTPRKSASNSPSKQQKTKYVEKGWGELKVNTFVDPASGRVRARLLCRREKVMTTILNAPILPQDDSAINEFNIVNDAYVKFAVIECVEGQPDKSQLSTYLIKPKDSNQLNELLEQIEAAQERVREQDEGENGTSVDAN